MSFAAQEGDDIVIDVNRQWYRPAEGQPVAPARALCDNSRKGHRARLAIVGRVLEDHGGRNRT